MWHVQQVSETAFFLVVWMHALNVIQQDCSERECRSLDSGLHWCTKSSAHASAAQKTVHKKMIMAAAHTELAQARCDHTAITVAGGVRPHVQGTSGKHPTC